MSTLSRKITEEGIITHYAFLSTPNQHMMSRCVSIANDLNSGHLTKWDKLVSLA